MQRGDLLYWPSHWAHQFRTISPGTISLGWCMDAVSDGQLPGDLSRASVAFASRELIQEIEAGAYGKGYPIVQTASRGDKREL